jgi:hypothetical protein
LIYLQDIYLFGLTDLWLIEEPAYAASVFPHPAHKWRYFTKKWQDRPDWIKTAQKKMKEF